MTEGFGHSGGLEALDTSGNLTRLRTAAEAGDVASGLKYVDSAFTVFRGVMIGLFVLLFISALMGIISGGFLLVAADQDMDGHDGWKSRARAMGGADIAIMFIFLAFSSYALYLMVRYEKAMSYMIHRISTGSGMTPVITTAQQHLNMQNTVQMQQLPQGQVYPVTLPTTHVATHMTSPATAASAAPPAGFSFE